MAFEVGPTRARGTLCLPGCRRVVRRVLLPSLALLTLTLAASAQAENERERPWPDEWPIVLPPIEGPLPPAPPPAPETPAGSRAGARVVEEIEALRRNVRQTRYQHHRVIRERTGTYYWDCSLMVHWVLERAARRSVHHLRNLQRARAEHFVRTIERAPTDTYRRGWRRIERIQDVRPGDVFAWRRPRGFPSRNTGHTGFVIGAPRPVPRIPHAYAVRVADATGSRHQDDTRPWPGEGGFGIGTLVFLTDGDGHGTHYGWAGTRSGGYVVTPILFGRVGP